MSAPERTDGRRTGHALDVAAVLLLLVGGIVLPVIGWVVGVVLLWVSTSWRVGEKVLGTLIFPGGLLFPALLGMMGFATSCPERLEVTPAGEQIVVQSGCPDLLAPWATGVLVAVVVAAPIAVAVLLLRRADARRAGRRP